MTAPPQPLLGPGVDWVDGADVAACCVNGECDDPSIFDAVAHEASMVLFEISGRQFTGLLESNVRPARQTCGCFGVPSSGLATWSWTGGTFGSFGWWWQNDCGDRMGCQPLSYVRLAGYPVREILEVKVDGVVIPEAAGVDAGDGTHFGGWRLDRWRRLTRLARPGPPVIPQLWPSCQNLSLADTESGTFSITYTHGIDPPSIAKQAAAQLACQLFLSCGGSECQLPAGVTRVTRQGVEIERGLLVNWFDPTKPTGLVALDTFLRAYWRPMNARRPAVYSPDLQAFPLRMSTEVA